MTFTRTNGGYVLRFEYGEKFIETLTQFIKDEGIKGAFFNGLGGAQSAVLGLYNVDDENDYHWHSFSGPLEVTNITGNVAYDDKNLIIHAHATISGPDMNASGGHVKEILVAGTIELLVTLSGDLKRKYDEQTGLKLLD